MAKALTAAGIARYKPGKERREIRDGAATGLYLILRNYPGRWVWITQPAGRRSGVLVLR